MVRHTYLVLAVIAILVGFASLPAAAQSGRTFYIDYASGSNSNSGTSESTPWKTDPYMQTAAACTGTGSAPSYAHQAGDHFIFKGGVSWPAACFEMLVAAGGSPTAPDYYGVDKAWYEGSYWTQPKFDLDYSVPSGNFVVGGYNLSYITFDNFEIVHQGIGGSSASVCGGTGATPYATQAAFEFTGTSHAVTVQNSYMHDWVTTSSGGYGFLQYSAGSIFNATLADGNTISDADGWYGESHKPMTFGGAIQNVAEARNNTIHDTMAGMFSVASVHGNELYGISGQGQTVDPCVHSQVIESDNAEPGTIYNNLIHDNYHGSIPVGVVIYECAATIIYNNVMYNNNVPGYNADITIGDTGFCANGGTGGTVHIYNNTIDCSNGVACFATDAKGTLQETVNLKDNNFITNGSAINLQSSIQTFNNTNNYTMRTSEASTYGFTSANKYAPTSSDSNITGTGVNLTNSCVGTLSSLCSDAEGATWFGGSYVARQTTGGWDLGAYRFGAASASQPSPPTGLTAIVQ
jgi:hypothetical protein